MTNAWTVKRAFIDTVRRAPEFRDIQVELAHPGQGIEMQALFISRLTATDRNRALGKSHRREVLSLEVAVVSELHGNDWEDAEERAWTMFDGVERVVLDDPSLGGKCLFAEISSFDQRTYAGDQVRACEITIVVDVTADKDMS